MAFSDGVLTGAPPKGSKDSVDDAPTPDVEEFDPKGSKDTAALLPPLLLPKLLLLLLLFELPKGSKEALPPPDGTAKGSELVPPPEFVSEVESDSVNQRYCEQVRHKQS